MKRTATSTQLVTTNPDDHFVSLTGGPNSNLRLSVILSSAGHISLSELFTELWILRTNAIDFYPRLIDIREILRNHSDSARREEEVEDRTLLERFKYDVDSEDECTGDVEEIAAYIQQQRIKAATTIQNIFGTPNVSPEMFKIPAIATFFPEISSNDPDKARASGLALAGAVKLAKLIGAKVVEFVMGLRVERCSKDPQNPEDCKCDYVYNYKVETRIKEALKIIKKHPYKIAKHKDPAKCIRLAAEIEPGYSYVLNNTHAVSEYIKLIKDKGMADIVGLNLDIGHLMILANSHREADCVSISDVELWKDHVFHAHISDNVGHHFRDLVPGTIHPLYGKDNNNAFESWLRLCAEIANQNKSFSQYIALELEGCSRIQWVQQSLLRLGELIRKINSDTSVVKTEIKKKKVAKKKPFAKKKTSPKKVTKKKATKKKTAKKKGNKKCDIMLVTAADIELETVKNLLSEKYDREFKIEDIESNNIYIDLGVIGKKKVFLVPSQMGSGGPGGSQQTVTDAILEYDPCAIILVGIAFGIDKKKNDIGDILVSKELYYYEKIKVGTSKKGRIIITERGDRPPATPRLLKGLLVATKARWDGAKVKDGIILSGAKLIDNKDYRDSINEQCPEAIGGEMEGYGLYSAAHSKKKDWVVVKAICDWADGKKRHKKKERQIAAARNSISFVFHAIEKNCI